MYGYKEKSAYIYTRVDEDPLVFSQVLLGYASKHRCASELACCPKWRTEPRRPQTRTTLSLHHGLSTSRSRFAVSSLSVRTFCDDTRVHCRVGSLPQVLARLSGVLHTEPEMSDAIRQTAHLAVHKTKAGLANDKLILAHVLAHAVLLQSFNNCG